MINAFAFNYNFKTSPIRKNHFLKGKWFSLFYFVRVLQNKSTPSERRNNDHHNNNDHHRDYIFYTCFHLIIRFAFAHRETNVEKKLKQRTMLKKNIFISLKTEIQKTA
jgi:hypothetical protein